MIDVALAHGACFLLRAALSPLKLLFGSDLFVSYARADGTRYAEALCEAISSLKARIDPQETTPSRTLPALLRLALVFSKTLVVVTTRETLASTAIEDEIRIFLEWSKDLILVSLDGQPERALWTRVEGLERVADGAGPLDGGPRRRGSGGPPQSRLLARQSISLGGGERCGLFDRRLIAIGWQQHQVAVDEATRRTMAMKASERCPL